MTQTSAPSPEALWRAAALVAGGLPSYESVVLGQLGRHADGAAVALVDRSGEITLAWGGRGFENWLGAELHNRPLSDLAEDHAQPIRRAVQLALETCEPAQCHRNLIRNGGLEASSLIALPLSSRGGAAALLFTAGETTRTSLIDAVFQATQHGVLVLSALRGHDGALADFEIVTANASAAEMMGRPPRDLPGRSIGEVAPNLHRTDALRHLAHVVEKGERRTFDLHYPRSGNGRALHLQVEAGAIGDLVAVTLTDVGPLREREASYRLLFESNPVPMWVFERGTRRFLAVNDAAIAHYGYERAAFLGMTLDDITLAGGIPAGVDRPSDGRFPAEAPGRHRKADGTAIEVIAYARDLLYADAPAVLLAATDVTERRRAEARVAYLAHHDALTGLPNRLMFRERLSEAVAAPGAGPGPRDHEEGFGLLCLDLDGFKAINDTLGHAVGDVLLAQVGARLRACLREDVDCVARLGGDEFAVLAPGLAAPDAAQLAHRLIDAVGRPYAAHGLDILVGASIGIALAPGDGPDPETLLRHADMALYRAKADGRRTFRFFEAAMDAELQARQCLERDLHEAMRTGALETHYQPLVDLTRDVVTVCEALVRWPHPERGWVSPAEFIPLAEEVGLIGPLADRVLRQACADAATWPDRIRVAVNLSPVQFRDPDALLRNVAAALRISGLTPDRLELEITESVLLSDSAANVAVLRQLKALGVRIAMDDFGTGYSSLSYLHRFPFDKIKIDQSFVREMGASRHCAAIVQAVTGLGASLGITTVAEGVETVEQLEHLRRAGCDEAQGYLFARPMPHRALRRFLDHGGEAERGAWAA